jgi:hypothetical protein
LVMTDAVSETEREEDSREKEQDEGGVRARERYGRPGSSGSTIRTGQDSGSHMLPQSEPWPPACSHMLPQSE